jgi:ABC-type lipoprotein release transport system permease subunit
VDIFKMALRNVWRNKRRTIVTVAAMSLALLVMILYSGLVTGYLKSAKQNLLDLELGDIQIHALGYRDAPSVFTIIDDPDAVLEKLRAAGLKGAPRLLAAGLAAVKDTSAGAAFIGIDVAADKVVSRIFECVLKGKWLDADDPQGVVLGRRMAKNLNAAIGDELVVLTQGTDGSMANELYRIRGVLKSVSSTVDRSGVFMTEAAFRSLMVLIFPSPRPRPRQWRRRRSSTSRRGGSSIPPSRR